MVHVKEGSGHRWSENRSHPSAGSYGFTGWRLCLLSSSSLAGSLGSSAMFLHILQPQSNSWARGGWSERTPGLTLDEGQDKHAHAMQGFHGHFRCLLLQFPSSLRQEGLLLSRVWWWRSLPLPLSIPHRNETQRRHFLVFT